MKWNLNKLAEAMDPIVPTKILKKYLEANFDKFYKIKFNELMNSKLGITGDHP